MRRYIRLQRIIDTAEVVLVVAVLLYAGCYTINYYFRDCSSSVHAMAILLLCAAIYYACTLLLMNLVVSKDREYDKSHKFMSGFKNRKSAYDETLKIVKKTFMWKNFVRGVNKKTAIKLCITLKVALTSVILSTLSVAQNWGYLNVLLPVLLLITLAASLMAYRLTNNIFRSGSGYIKYLVHSHKPLCSVDADFQGAEIISKNLRISYATIYYRTDSYVFIIDRDDICEHAFGINSIALTSAQLHESHLLSFNSRDEYIAVANAVLL